MNTVNQPVAPARFAALRHRNFTLLWSGLIVSNVGTWMQNVATGWLILQLTNSALWLGLLGLSFAVPMIFLPLVGGAIADRINRIHLLYFTQTAMMLNAFVLTALTWAGRIQAWELLVSSFIGAALLAFDNPTRQALIPDLVPTRDLLNAISLNSASYTGAALLGPAIAGVMLGPFGPGTLFFINAVSFLAFIFALVAMHDVPTHAGGHPGRLGASILSGLLFAWRDRRVLILLILSALAGIFGRSYQNLLPIFARDIMHGGSAGYGLLLSAAGAGALLGGLGLASLRNINHPERVMIASGVLFSLSILLFALSSSILVGSLLLFASGVLSTVFGTIIATFLQIAAPKESRGRVMSLYSITLIGLPSLGALASGAVAELLGGVSGAPRAVMLAALILGILLLAVTPFFWRRKVMQAEEG